MAQISGNGIKWWSVRIGEDEALAAAGAVRNGRLTMGPLTEELECKMAETLNMKNAVAFSSCSTALYSSLLALGIGTGDEVIIPNRTFVAAANSVLLCGARPILADVLPERPLISTGEVEKLMTPKTKAIIICHLNGWPVDIDGIRALASENGIKIIEDSARSLFSKDAEGRFLGTVGDIGCFSFGMTKFLSAGYGGLAVAKDKGTASNLRKIRNHGRYGFEDSYQLPGCNFKFPDILASIALKRLEKKDETISRHNEIYSIYKKGVDGLKKIRLMDSFTERGELPLWIEALTDDREKLMGFLKENGIQSLPYASSLNSIPGLNADGRPFPCSEYFEKKGVILPSGSGQTDEDIHRVLKALKEYEKEP